VALDLHGVTIHQGWKIFKQEVDDAYHRKVKAFKEEYIKNKSNIERVLSSRNQ